jgi:hypothetical protein
VLDTPPSPPPLDPPTFDQAAESTYNLRYWLDATMVALRREFEKINTKDSGFKGSAAEAFHTVLLNLHNEMKLLHDDLMTNKDWTQMLHNNAAAARTFWSQIRDAWSHYRAVETNLPSEMIHRVMQQIEQQIDALGAETDGFSNPDKMPPWDALQRWPIYLDFGAGRNEYDLKDTSVFNKIDNDMKAHFDQIVSELDRAMTSAFTNLRDSFNDTLQNIHDPQKFVPTPLVPPGGGDKNKGGGGGGGGGGSNHNYKPPGGDKNKGGGGGGGGGKFNYKPPGGDKNKGGGGGGGGGGGSSTTSRGW